MNFVLYYTIRLSILGASTLLNIKFNDFCYVRCFDQNFGELVEPHRFISYYYIPPTFHAFNLSMASKLVSQSHVEAPQVPKWKVAMEFEVDALISQRTWKLVSH